MNRKALNRFKGIFLSLVLLGAMVGTASAVTYDLCTGATTLTMPGGEIVPVWGFGIDDASAACDGAAVPGPVLSVPAGDPALTINLRNTLPDPVSLNILGQQLIPNSGPVWAELNGTVVANPRTSGNFSARVRSFAHEAAAGGGAAVYSWPNFKPGTYMLTSGTDPAKQVQMGLYAAVRKDEAAGVAYGDNPATPTVNESVPYARELVLVYSEIDPAMNAAIAEGRYGANAAGPLPHVTSSLERDPKYFLVNGMAFDPAVAGGGGLDPVNAGYYVGQGQRLLVRFLNAGYEVHAPQLLNIYMELVAEDGNRFKYSPRQQYGFELPAGKTVDAVIEPAVAGKFPIYDAMLNLTNSGAATPGGMLAYVNASDCAFTWDLDPDTGDDGDVDGLDLDAAFPLTPAELAAFALQFGSVCP